MARCFERPKETEGRSRKKRKKTQKRPGSEPSPLPLFALLLVRILFSCANSGLGYWPRPVPCGGKTILNHGGHGDHGDRTRKTDGEDLGEPGLALYCRWRIGSFSVSSVTSVVSKKEIWSRPSAARPRWAFRVSCGSSVFSCSRGPPQVLGVRIMRTIVRLLRTSILVLPGSRRARRALRDGRPLGPR